MRVRPSLLGSDIELDPPSEWRTEVTEKAPVRGVCHADRAALLLEVYRRAFDWEALNGIFYTEAPSWPDRMRAAEDALIASCKRLADLPDCSE